MNFLNYSLAALISYLGIVAGLIIMRAAKEEQKAGKKYFVLMQSIILLLIVIFLLYFFKLNFIVSLIILLIILIVVIKRYKMRYLKQSYNLFPLLGVIFYLSLDNPKFMFIEASLIFLYGLVSSSLLIDFKKKNYLEIILKHSTFLIIALLLFSFETMF